MAARSPVLLMPRMAHGRMEQWGFVTPKTRTHPAGLHLLIGHFIWNRITAKPGIARVSEDAVFFSNGSSKRFDTMLAATGHDVHLPFLSQEISPVRGRWLDLFHQVVRPGAPGCIFLVSSMSVVAATSA